MEPEQVLSLAVSADMEKVVQPLYHQMVMRVAKMKNFDTAQEMCVLANAIEHIGLVRDKEGWIEFMRSSINPDYNPGGYLSVY